MLGFNSVKTKGNVFCSLVQIFASNNIPEIVNLKENRNFDSHQQQHLSFVICIMQAQMIAP